MPSFSFTLWCVHCAVHFEDLSLGDTDTECVWLLLFIYERVLSLSVLCVQLICCTVIFALLTSFDWFCLVCVSLSVCSCSLSLWYITHLLTQCVGISGHSHFFLIGQFFRVRVFCAELRIIFFPFMFAPTWWRERGEIKVLFFEVIFLWIFRRCTRSSLHESHTKKMVCVAEV